MNLLQKHQSLIPEEMPLVKILEGGTWLAGRRIAAQLREGSTAPILLDSDGTVF